MITKKVFNGTIMSSSPYAPVVIFVYNRLDETKNLIGSLIKNELAAESDVFIFSDGAKNKDDAIKVSSVREYIASLYESGIFKSVTITEAEKNKGLAGSVIAGVTDIIEKYGRVIVLEDDLTVSSVFLLYMNKCLDYYVDDGRIWSVSGFSRDLKSSGDMDQNVYLSYRAASEGWGTWKNRWDMVDWDVKDYKRFVMNPFANAMFSRGGDDLPVMLRMQMRGYSDSWAIRFCYSQYKHNMYTVLPRKTLVKKGGLYNGTHCGEARNVKELENQTLSETEENWCYDHIEIDPAVAKEFRELVNPGIVYRIRVELRHWKRKLLRKK